MMSSAAKVRLYPVMTHCRLGRVVWNSRRIVGMATLRMVPSSPAIRTAISRMARVIQRRGSGSGSVAKRNVIPLLYGI